MSWMSASGSIAGRAAFEYPGGACARTPPARHPASPARAALASSGRPRASCNAATPRVLRPRRLESSLREADRAILCDLECESETGRKPSREARAVARTRRSRSPRKRPSAAGSPTRREGLAPQHTDLCFRFLVALSLLKDCESRRALADNRVTQHFACGNRQPSPCCYRSDACVGR